MKIIALMDIHGDKNSIKTLETPIKAADLVLLVGDITDFGRADKVKDIISLTRNMNPNVFAITGNCDYPETTVTLDEIDCSIENRIRRTDNIQFAGLGASLPTPGGNTPNEVSDQVLRERLQAIEPDLDTDCPLILVSHQPPSGTKNDMVQTGAHVGSSAVREFIQKWRPMVCFTGHIHEGSGIDTIGETSIVNPGPAYMGYYVYAEITDTLKSLEILRH